MEKRRIFKCQPSQNLFLCLFFATLLCACSHLPKSDFSIPINNGLPIEMAYVEGGQFSMGGTLDDSLAMSWEYPAHMVTLPDYYIGKYEITIDQFHQFVKSTDYIPESKRLNGGKCYGTRKGTLGWHSLWYISYLSRPNGLTRPRSEYNHPALYISWNDAMAFCKWLSKKTGYHVTLPTEAQWEFAARGGNRSKNFYFIGSDTLSKVSCHYTPPDYPTAFTYPVGSFAPNELGLYDMGGNAMEWCWDYFDDYTTEIKYDPHGPKQTDDSHHVVKGGDWGKYAQCCRASFRYHYYPSESFSHLGFRIVIIP